MGSKKNEFKQQTIKTLSVAGKAWVVYIALFSLIIGCGKLLFNISADQFTRDPNQIVNIPFYIGAISNLGIIFWSATVALCIFSVCAIKRYAPNSAFRGFMLHSSIISTVLLLDDLYMWHEQMFPDYLKIPEIFIYLFYVIYFLYILVRFRNVILQSNYLVLFAALFFMGTSVGMDIMVDIRLFATSLAAFYRHETLFEDFFKSLGILTWLVYFSHVAFSRVLPEVKNSVMV